jgi:methylase of polypeptide subunit release factors
MCCGTGTSTIWLARQGFDVIGLDLSAEAVDIARRRADEQEIATPVHRQSYFCIIKFRQDQSPRFWQCLLKKRS